MLLNAKFAKDLNEMGKPILLSYEGTVSDCFTVLQQILISRHLQAGVWITSN